MNILVTSAGRRGYIVDYFKKAMNGGGLVYACNSHLSPALLHADKYVISPLIYDPRYIDFLLDYAIQNDISALVSLFDIDLPILARSKERMRRQGIDVIVSDYEVTQICNDKWKTFQFLRQHEIPVPKTFISLAEARASLENGEVHFPLVMKPRWGMGSIGLFTADTIDEMDILYRKVHNAIINSYLKFESQADLEHAVLIQEKLSGQEYGLDIINDLSGRYVTTLVNKKLALRYGDTDSAVTVQNDSMCQLGRKLSLILRHISNLNADCFLVDDVVYVLEMNCRIGGGYTFPHLAGADLPLAIIKWLKGELVTEDLFTIKYGVEGAKDISPIVLRLHDGDYFPDC